MGRLAQQMINDENIMGGGIGTQLTEEELLIQGFLSDMTQSQGMGLTGDSNMQNIISDAKLAMQEYDEAQQDSINIQINSGSE